MTTPDDPLVSTDWLAAHLDDPKVKVIDATFKMPGVLPLPKDDYLASHIPGAVFFDVDAVSDHSNPLPHMFPSAEQFGRWAGQVPDGFRFAVKAPPLVLRRPEVVAERVRALGNRLGCVRVVVEHSRDDQLLDGLRSAFHGMRLALDLRHETWDGVEAALEDGAVRVGDWAAPAPWRYLRFREPPYDEAGLTAIAARLRPLLDSGVDVFAFFRHEDEPTAPKAALRLLGLLER